MKKRALSLALALVMALSLFPVAAFAAEAKPVTVGNITLSGVVSTDKYETARDLFGEDESPAEYQFLYSLGMVGFELDEEPGEYGYASFWCYLIPDDAEIVFDLTKERSVQVDFYGLKSVSDASGLPAYQADFISGLSPADPSVSKWGVSEEDIDEYADILAAYDLMVCWSGNQDPVYVMFESKAIALTTPGFTDVPTWCEKEAAWAAWKGITNGYGSNDKFAPTVECPHIQILTFLWRAADKPISSAKCPVSVASYYQEAANWAYEKGLIDDSFNPDAPCTRAQAVQYIWQARGKEDAKTAASFSDVDAAAPYAGAVSWAVEKKITNGRGGNDTFAPDLTCSRGEIAAFLYRAYHN